ncbi:endonuclease V [Phytomonospora endophytica]|uniref:Endonuclease V n=1 Tax=Phytomonospora endophytica TaxID=714109 RepID=A0A841FXU1_9ACTN|nr:endonuclease V [Phytomonospora endophytica]MBB6037279.1 deoxyribonuclease V [Phytomonospora endophytica]GIG69977.1 endonuclease V [Phytomonospora endophytica]
MDIPPIPPWPADEAGALAEQKRLRGLLEDGPGDAEYRLVTGVDVSYGEERLIAAAVTIDTATMETVEESTREGVARFPYVPGLLAFRELPTLLDALAGLKRVPGLLVCDGHGLAHPRGFGLACHLGVLLGLPTIGVAKNAPWPTTEPGPERGDQAPILRDGEVVGATLRTQTGVKPVYVSTGHRTELGAACRAVLALAPKHRQPETTRRSDGLGRRLLRG